jgi:hypothetical protein
MISVLMEGDNRQVIKTRLADKLKPCGGMQPAHLPTRMQTYPF